MLSGGDLPLRAALPQADAARLHMVSADLSVRLADDPGRIWPARLAGAVPAATRELPSAVLGEAGGGPIPVAPAAPGEPALQALQPVLLLDLTVPGLPVQRVGTRAWVRLELGYAPLAQQLYQQASQVFLQHAGRS